MPEPARYRKRPVVVDAVQWDGTPEGATPIINWILANGPRAARYQGPARSGSRDTGIPARIMIDTLEGAMAASPSDWIVRGVQGEFYPVKSDIFAATYEPA